MKKPMSDLSINPLDLTTGSLTQSEEKKVVGEKILLNLGLQPLVNNLCLGSAAAIAAKKYPLCATITDDLEIKLNHEVPSDELYGNYLYFSGISSPYINHCRLLWHKVKHLKHDVILDIGGNDGTLLRALQSQSDDKLNLYNVDACKTFRRDSVVNG